MRRRSRKLLLSREAKKAGRGHKGTKIRMRRFISETHQKNQSGSSSSRKARRKYCLNFIYINYRD
jgi:hypothetical protein